VIALLATCAGVVVVLAIAAVVVARQEADDGKGVEAEIVAALRKAVGELDEAQNDDLGAPVITARMSGLVEFVHGLSSVRDGERRTSTAPFLVVLAMAVVLAGGAIAIVERVEGRLERASCVDVVAGLQAKERPAAPRGNDAPTTTAAATTNPPAPADPTTTTVSTKTTTAPVGPPEVLPASAVSEFLDSCLNGVPGEGPGADDDDDDTESKGERHTRDSGKGTRDATP